MNGEKQLVVIVVHPNGEATAKLPQKQVKCPNRKKAILLVEYQQLDYRLEWELPHAA